jgi:hypothetical protein
MQRKKPLRAKKGLKRAPIRPKPKQGRKALIAQADGLIQRAALARDKGLCQRCKNPAAEGHHIVHRRYFSLRWQLDNVVSLCRYCHSLDGTIRKQELTDFCIRWVGGRDAMDALRLRAHTEPSEEPRDAIRRMRGEM